MSLRLNRGIGLSMAGRQAAAEANPYAAYALAIDFAQDHYQLGSSSYSTINDMPGYVGPASPVITGDGYVVGETDLMQVAAALPAVPSLWIWEIITNAVAETSLYGDWANGADQRLTPHRVNTNVYSVFGSNGVGSQSYNMLTSAVAQPIVMGMLFTGTSFSTGMRTADGGVTLFGGVGTNVSFPSPAGVTLWIGCGRLGEAPAGGNTIVNVTRQDGTFSAAQADDMLAARLTA